VAVACADFTFLLPLKPKMLLKADWPLLLTFACFFVFIGNVSRISAVQQFFAITESLKTLLPKTSFSLLTSPFPFILHTPFYQDRTIGNKKRVRGSRSSETPLFAWINLWKRILLP